MTKDELKLEERKVKALEKIASSLDALTVWFEEIDKEEWDGMFNVFDALRRIDYGERMFVGSFNGVIFGHCWVDKTESEKFYIYNVFSKKTEEPRKYGATDMLYYVIKTHTIGTIWAKVDEWNVKSIKVFEKLGFTCTN